MMNFTEFIKKELLGWKNFEIIGIFIVFVMVFVNAVILKDSIVAVLSAICGILYTVMAGKGKISCYFFGLAGSGCYIYLAFVNALWGNMLLYLCYYIPMQMLGIFKWKKHLKEDSREIIKTKLSKIGRLRLVLAGFIGSFFSILILAHFNDKSPIIDGITTFLSILGMYLTVRRSVEQWTVWMIVNGLSFLMWLNIVLHGTKAYSTVVMWGAYFILAVYFYFVWKKELSALKSC